MSARIIIAIARKDIVDAVRNHYMLGGIVLPFAVWLLFGLIFPVGGSLKIGPVAIFDQGSSQLVQRLTAERSVERIVPVRSLDELTAVVRKDAIGGLVLPPDFDEALGAARTPEVILLVNGRRGGGELTVFRRLVDGLIQASAGRPPVARLVERDVNAPENAPQRPNFNLQGFLFTIVLVMGLAMTGVFVVPTILVEEKEKHTLRAILVSPASYADVVAGKALAGLAYALFGAAVLLLLNDALLGNLPLVAVSILLGSLFAVEVGLLLGALCSTTAQVNTWSTAVLLLLTAPTWTAGVSLSAAVDAAMRVIPTYYVAQLVSFARGDSTMDNPVAALAILLVSVAVFFPAVVWSLRRLEC